MTATAFEFDIFLSRRESVAAVAREVADILTAAGYRVIVQDYDFTSSGQFVLDIDKALKQARHLLILYSHDYPSSFWTRQEFANFLVAVAASNGERRIGLLRCDAPMPDGLLQGTTFGDLARVTDPAERHRIVLAVARGEAPAARPSPRILGGTMSGAALPPGTGGLRASARRGASDDPDHQAELRGRHTGREG